jgi:hypothetical protein
VFAVALARQPGIRRPLQHEIAGDRVADEARALAVSTTPW